MLSNEYGNLTLADLRHSQEHRERIIVKMRPTMAEVDLSAADVAIVPDRSGASNMWGVRVTIPIKDPHRILGCTTLDWRGSGMGSGPPVLASPRAGCAIAPDA